MRKFILPVLCLLSLSACVEMEGEICNASNIKDIAGLEGNYLFRMYNPENLEMESQVFGIERVEKGTYYVNGDEAFKTCLIGGNYYSQSLTQGTKLFTAYRIEAFWNESGLAGFQLLLLGSSKSVLDQRGFPYRIERTTDERGESSIKLVLENKDASPDSTTQILDAMAMSFNFIPSRNASGVLKKGKISDLVAIAKRAQGT